MLTPAIVFASVAILISAVNYLLLLALARRLRSVQAELALVRAGGAPANRIEAPRLIVEPGEQLDLDRLRGALPEFGSTERTLVGFFSLECSACLNQVPPFNSSIALGRSLQRIAVVAAPDGPDGAGNPLVKELAPSTVVRLTGGSRGPLHELFEVAGFPAFAMVDDRGRILASGWEVAGVASVGDG